jgi:ketosteroid isomerase-like protein
VADRLELIRGFFPVYEERGVEAALPLFDPGVTWMAPPEWMDQPVYCGHQGLRDLDTLWRSNFDDFGLELEELCAVGDRIVALIFLHGRIKGTEQRIEQRASWLIDFGEEGLITRLCAYFSWAEAFEAARRS